MSSFWIRNNVLDNVLDNAFSDVNTSILSIDFSQYWGHYGSTIKLKVMHKLAHICNIQTDKETHGEIIDNLFLMLEECDRNSNYILTSPSYTTPITHINEDFIFCDFENTRFVKIAQNKIEPIITQFTPCYTRLMFALKYRDEKSVESLLESSLDCYPEMIYKNETALMQMCSYFPKYAIKLIDKYGDRCIIPQKCDKLKYGIELALTIINRHATIALKLIETFGSEYGKYYIDNSLNTLLTLSLIYELPNVSLKLIEVCGINCYPDCINKTSLTALIIACEKCYENVAITLFNTFGPDNCLLDHKTSYKATAESIAEQNELNEFLELINFYDLPGLIDENGNYCFYPNNLVSMNEKSTRKFTLHENVRDNPSCTNIIFNAELKPEIKSTVKPLEDNMVHVNYKGVKIASFIEACDQYLKMASIDDPNTNDFKKVVKFFT